MKKKVRLISLNLNERDLSIALVGLKQYAELNKKVKSNFDIHIHQWNKNYANMGKDWGKMTYQDLKVCSEIRKSLLK